MLLRLAWATLTRHRTRTLLAMLGVAVSAAMLLDMVMLTLPGGQERTEEEYRQLLAKAGFRLTQVVPTESAVSVVEAVRE